jgi:O-antigen/teichoic acid export membrane protein
VDPEEEAQLEIAASPTGTFAGREGKDFRVLAAGTAQNVAGLAVFALAQFVTVILISRAFGGTTEGAVAVGVVTVGTQFAFIAAAGTRFGMDMAAVRYVAIDAGAGHLGRIRDVVRASATIAAGASLTVGAIVFLLAGPIGRSLAGSASADANAAAIRAAAVAIPFVALTYVWLGGSRGLKVMRHTLYVQWVAQPVLWIGLMLALWQVDKTPETAVWAYAASWLVAAAAARVFWGSLSRGHAHEDPERGLVRTLTRYGAPRAPAALFSQGLFWIDFFVASALASSGSTTSEEVGVYAACVRVAVALVLFLTAVSYVFSPFVADLHARGERDRLDRLFKAITRWTVAGTIPALVLMLVDPQGILRIFGGSNFAQGTTALRILAIGQGVNVSVGAAGFVLIMAGRTGWDLVVYVASAVLDFTLALALVPRFGINGAAAAQAITVALSNWLRLSLVRRFVGIFPWDGTYARLLVPAAGCAGAMIVIRVLTGDATWYVRLLLIGVAGVVAYVPLLLLFGLAESERVAVRAGLAKLRSR